MKLAPGALLLLVMGATSSAHADSLQGANGVVGSLLQIRGGGLAPLYASCPKNINNRWSMSLRRSSCQSARTIAPF
jgi:hypothetical protein